MKKKKIKLWQKFPCTADWTSFSKMVSQGALEVGSFQLQIAGEAELKTLDLLQIPTGFKCLR